MSAGSPLSYLSTIDSRNFVRIGGGRHTFKNHSPVRFSVVAIATWMQLRLGVGMMMDSDYGRGCL
jgi:hypothetical protein